MSTNLGNVAGLVLKNTPPVEKDGVTEKRYVLWAKPVGQAFDIRYFDRDADDWISLSSGVKIDDAALSSLTRTWSVDKLVSELSNKIGAADIQDKADLVGGQVPSSQLNSSDNLNLDDSNVLASAKAVNDTNSKVDANTAALNALDNAYILQNTPFDASTGVFPSGAQAGYVYIVGTAGTVDGESFQVNQSIVALTDNASTNTYAGNWLRRIDAEAQTGSTLGLTPQNGVTNTNAQAELEHAASERSSIDSKYSGANIDVGTIDPANATTFPTGAGVLKGHGYRSISSGTIQGEEFGVDDILRAMTDNPSDTDFSDWRKEDNQQSSGGINYQDILFADLEQLTPAARLNQEFYNVTDDSGKIRFLTGSQYIEEDTGNTYSLV